MMIDSHIHIFHPEIAGNRKNFFNDENFSLLYSDEKSKLATAADVLEYMESENIEKCIAMGFPWQSQDLLKKQNEYFARIQSETEGRIICFGSVFPGKNRDFSKSVSDIKNLGLAGIGEIAFYTNGFISENRIILSDLLHECRRYSLPVCIHTNEPLGHPYHGKYDPCFWDLFPILENFSDLRMILPHWGGGLFFYELMPEVKNKFKNFYYDTSASPYIYSPEIYRAAVDIIGPDRILFGTDFPLLKTDRYIREMKSVIGDDSIKKITGLNARKLLDAISYK